MPVVSLVVAAALHVCSIGRAVVPSVMPTTLNDLRPTLVRARIARGWSQAHLADLLDVLPSAVGHWEVGRRTPTEVHARQWANLLRVELPGDTTGWFYREEIRKVAVCGTRSGYLAHVRRHEDACGPCKADAARYAREWKAAKVAAEIDAQIAAHRAAQSV